MCPMQWEPQGSGCSLPQKEGGNPEDSGPDEASHHTYPNYTTKHGNTPQSMGTQSFPNLPHQRPDPNVHPPPPNTNHVQPQAWESQTRQADPSSAQLNLITPAITPPVQVLTVIADRVAQNDPAQFMRIINSLLQDNKLPLVCIPAHYSCAVH